MSDKWDGTMKRIKKAGKELLIITVLLVIGLGILAGGVFLSFEINKKFDEAWCSAKISQTPIIDLKMNNIISLTVLFSENGNSCHKEFLISFSDYERFNATKTIYDSFYVCLNGNLNTISYPKICNLSLSPQPLQRYHSRDTMQSLIAGNAAIYIAGMIVMAYGIYRIAHSYQKMSCV